MPGAELKPEPSAADGTVTVAQTLGMSLLPADSPALAGLAVRLPRSPDATQFLRRPSGYLTAVSRTLPVRRAGAAVLGPEGLSAEDRSAMYNASYAFELTSLAFSRAGTLSAVLDLYWAG